VFRELLEQGYSIVSADYRGSSGYGRGFYEQIDYGGREVDDVHLSGQWMLENYPFLDARRVGAIGWSHGGLITLMNIFAHPQAYAVAYAGVPVSDLVERMGYEPPDTRRSIRRLSHWQDGARGYSGISQALAGLPCEGIADAATDSCQHERRRCECAGGGAPDSGVEGGGQEVRIQDLSGRSRGHYFNRIDTKAARESRREIWKFLAGYLKPDRAVK
jgi:hypothetical protein